MKQLVILGLAVLIAACSSSSAPKDVYTGAWTGTLAEQGDTISITTTTSQTGTAVSGSCTATSASSSGTDNFTCTLSGTSNAPAISFTMDFNDQEVIVFSGNYVTKDSVAGILTEATNSGTDTIPGFGFKKQ
jgi:hypothetical protein